MASHDPGTQPITRFVGIGLRTPHVATVLTTRPAIGWLEVHPENYLGGGPEPAHLDAIRALYPLSLHAVGLSLGSADGVDRDHLRRLSDLVTRFEPFLVSDHLSWSTIGGTYLNDLLPLPYTEEALRIVADNVLTVQDALRRPLLVENPSTYLRFRDSEMSEPEFLAGLVHRTGCRLLCDVNNIYVTCRNFGLDPFAFLDALPAPAIAEIHLAGHARIERAGQEILIDDHGSRVCPEVWDLYRHAISRFGPVPSLVEWDTDVPDLSVLLDEAGTAERIAEGAVPHVDAA